MNGKVYSYVVADPDNIRMKRNIMMSNPYYNVGDVIYSEEDEKIYKVLSLNFTKEV